ncbi:MAG: hypothetical protein KIS91_02595, partial [Anaerolineae bacterium]|nr:hypothetical protein [Anaerolineae bacterium]
RWGRNYLRTQGFDRDIDAFVRDDLPGLVQQAAPDLIQRLVGPLTDGILERVMRPGLLDWRAGRVRTLQDLEGHLTDLAEAWLQSDNARALVNRVIEEWLRPVLASVHAGVSPICARYGVPGDPFSLLTDFDPRVVIPADVGQRAQWTQLTDMVRDLVGGTSAAVLGTLLVVGQAAFFRLGPVGWIVSAVITAAALLIGKPVAEDYVKTLAIPTLLRGPILSEGRIRDIGLRNRDRIQDSLRTMLEGSDLSETLTRDVGQKLEALLEARAEEIRLLIS